MEERKKILVYPEDMERIAALKLAYPGVDVEVIEGSDEAEWSEDFHWVVQDCLRTEEEQWEATQRRMRAIKRLDRKLERRNQRRIIRRYAKDMLHSWRITEAELDIPGTIKRLETEDQVSRWREAMDDLDIPGTIRSIETENEASRRRLEEADRAIEDEFYDGGSEEKEEEMDAFNEMLEMARGAEEEEEEWC